MPYECRVIRDSVSSHTGVRLTSFVITYPRFIHSEFMTHRMLSRNAASSRAIPVKRMIDRVRNDPVVPETWGSNQPGMQAGAEVNCPKSCVAIWLDAMQYAVSNAERLNSLGVHKQLVNRLLEPFSWITVIATATDWANFFALRTHRDAQPEFQKIARMMLAAYRDHAPATLSHGQWHLPFITGADDVERAAGDIDRLKRWSAARCARVSYLNHEAKTPSPEEDEALFAKLTAANPRHMSPLEHQATPAGYLEPHIEYGQPSNLRGWLQYRKQWIGENITELPAVTGG